MAKSFKIALPPHKDTNVQESKKVVSKADEKKIQEVIKKGASAPKIVTPDTDKLKNINIHIFESELQTIRNLREQRPKPRGRRLAISVHDWIIEAIQEKIERERKSYKF